MKARQVPGEGIVAGLDGDEMGHALAMDYFVEQTASGQGVVVMLTNSGHFARGQVVSMGSYSNIESLAGVVVERL